MASKTSKLNKETAKKKEYLDYYSGMMSQRKMPMSQVKWMKATPGQMQLHQAGIDWEKDKPSARLKRSK